MATWGGIRGARAGSVFTSGHIWPPAAAAQTQPGLSRPEPGVLIIHFLFSRPSQEEGPIYGTESKIICMESLVWASKQSALHPGLHGKKERAADVFQGRVELMEGRFLKQEAHVKQLTEHLVGRRGFRDWRGGCLKLLNNNFILRQIKINCERCTKGRLLNTEDTAQA